MGQRQVEEAGDLGEHGGDGAWPKGRRTRSGRAGGYRRVLRSSRAWRTATAVAPGAAARPP